MPEAEDHERPILEVIVCSLVDAVEAERGGADRLEVVRELNRGGLTPDLPLVRAIRRAVSLPLRVMLRESEDDSQRGDDIRLRAAAIELEQIGAEGLVIGFLRNNTVDLERTGTILHYVPNMHATFHHAFDETESPHDTIAQLKRCRQIDRILSSGGPGELSVRAARLERYRQQAREEITLLAGGGLDEAAIRFLCARTGLREFHVGRAARYPRTDSGPVRAAQVASLRRLLLENSRSRLLLNTNGGHALE